MKCLKDLVRGALAGTVLFLMLTLAFQIIGEAILVAFSFPMYGIALALAAITAVFIVVDRSLK